MTVPEKIARLVAEYGWTQEAFAQRADLNRNTVRRILLFPDAPMRPASLKQCASALGFTMHELTTLPLEKLLQRLQPDVATLPEHLQRIVSSEQPELAHWLEREPARASQLTPDEVTELLSLQGTGGPLTAGGVDHFVARIERRRALHQKLDVVAGTHYLALVEEFLNLLYDKVQPYRDQEPDKAKPSRNNSA